MIVERNKKRGLFWLSGSQPFILWKSVSESLAGRVAILNLLGLSNQEIQRADINSFSTNKKQSNILESKSITEVYELIWRGYFPNSMRIQNWNGLSFIIRICKHISRETFVPWLESEMSLLSCVSPNNGCKIWSDPKL